MASQSDISLAFQRSGVGRSPTSSDFSFYSGYPDAGKVEGDIRAGGGGKSGFDPNSNSYPSGQNPGFGKSSSPSSTSPTDIVAQAQALRNFTAQSNQPAISQLQTQVDPNNSNSLQSRYNSLLDSIKGQSQVAQNLQTQATTSNLGARGLNPGSPEGQQALASAILPVTTQFGGLLSQTGLQEQGDVNQIQNAIAQLQTGNPESAVQSASTLAGQQTQLQGQQAYANAIAQAAQLQSQYHVLPAGASIYNAQTGNTSSAPTPNIFGNTSPGNSPSPIPTPAPVPIPGKTNSNSTTNFNPVNALSLYNGNGLLNGPNSSNKPLSSYANPSTSANYLSNAVQYLTGKASNFLQGLGI